MVGMIISKQAGLIGVPAAMLTGLLFGVINGALIAFLRLPPFIVTLGSLTAVRGFARLVGNDLTVFDPQLSFAFVGNSSLTIIPGAVSIPCLALIAFLVVVISWLILRRTVLGTHIYAVGGNESAARLAGINVAGGCCLYTARPVCLPASEGSCRLRGSTPPTACSSANLMSLTRLPR
jgi:ribose transport system permease protein